MDPDAPQIDAGRRRRSGGGATTDHLLVPIADRLAAHSITALRVSLGLVFLGFGLLKLVPGASPAEPLVMRTIDALSLGMVSGTGAVVLTAVVETFIGVTLVTGVALLPGLAVMAAVLPGIMSPLVLFTGDLFPGGLPTLEAQYVLKDVVLVTGGAVVAVGALRARTRLSGSAATVGPGCWPAQVSSMPTSSGSR